MLVSTKGRYALRAVVDIAENSRVDRVSLRSVAERQGISDKYLEAIIKPLVVAGILASVRGKNGGYQLARPASDITAGDVKEKLLLPPAAQKASHVNVLRCAEPLGFGWDSKTWWTSILMPPTSPILQCPT